MIEINRIYNQDCVVGMKGIDDGAVDLIVTSPPYDNLRTYQNEDEWTFDKFKSVAREMSRVLKPGGVAVWIVNDAVVGGGYTCSSFRQALYFVDECGLLMHQPLVWNKTNMRFPTPNRYHPSHEWMWVLSKGPPKTFNPINDRRNKSRGTRITSQRGDDDSTEDLHESRPIEEFGRRMSIWDINPGAGQKNKEAREHPAVFPEPLAADHIRSWSNPKDLVLDPMSGSGTTCRMAKELGRNYLGFEINQKYAGMGTRLCDRILI